MSKSVCEWVSEGVSEKLSEWVSKIKRVSKLANECVSRRTD